MALHCPAVLESRCFFCRLLINQSKYSVERAQHCQLCANILHYPTSFTVSKTIVISIVEAYYKRLLQLPTWAVISIKKKKKKKDDARH